MKTRLHDCKLILITKICLGREAAAVAVPTTTTAAWPTLSTP